MRAVQGCIFKDRKYTTQVLSLPPDISEEARVI